MGRWKSFAAAMSLLLVAIFCQSLGQSVRGHLVLANLSGEEISQVSSDMKMPYRFGLERRLRVDSLDQREWRLSRDKKIWTYRISAPERALSMNFGLKHFHLQEGMELRFRDFNSKKLLVSAFTAADVDPHGELWTPIFKSKDILIELDWRDVRRSRQGTTPFVSIESVNLGVRSPFQEDTSGACNIDVSCSEAESYQDQVNSVVKITIKGIYGCTATLLNNTKEDGRPILLTAYHCAISAANAPSVVAYWKFENSNCRAPGSESSGEAGDGQTDLFSSGSNMRVENEAGDMSLIELDDDLRPQFEAYFAGWDARDIEHVGGYGVHHPIAQEKRISFDDDAMVTTSYGGRVSPGDGSHIKVGQWELGTTESGSSGSALFNRNSRVIGQLHGGYASCRNESSDWYGRLAFVWDQADEEGNSLKNWLDPEQSGKTFLDGRTAKSE